MASSHFSSCSKVRAMARRTSGTRAAPGAAAINSDKILRASAGWPFSPTCCPAKSTARSVWNPFGYSDTNRASLFVAVPESPAPNAARTLW